MIAFEGFYKHLIPTNGKLLIIGGFHTNETVPSDERTKRLFGDLKVETLIDEFSMKHSCLNILQIVLKQKIGFI